MLLLMSLLSFSQSVTNNLVCIPKETAQKIAQDLIKKDLCDSTLASTQFENILLLRKINTIVQTPLTDVDFTKYVKGYNSNSYIYDLYAVCNHHGGTLGGHYTAYIKNANGKWYIFNDTVVNEIPETKVITNNAYCFLYRKKK